MGHAILNRQTELTALTIAALVGLAVVRLTVDEAHGVMLLSVVPIALLGVMHGVWAGLGAALFSTIAFELSALNEDRTSTLELIDVPLTFFVLGAISGSYAGGALGDFNLRRAARRSELRRGIRLGEIVVHYQPIVDAKSGRVRGLEALARWQHPQRGLLAPAEFVPLAEGDPTTIGALTAAVIDTATAEFAMLRARHGDGLRIGINLAATTLGQAETFTHLRRRFTEHDLPLSNLQLEITEDSLIRHPSQAAALLRPLRAEGVSIALDDFGTGYSSLAELSELPVSTLKIDRNLRDEPSGEMSGMIAPLIELAHQLDLLVIAEQVETEGVRLELERLGADELQGFLISRPLPASEVDEWLASFSADAARQPARSRQRPEQDSNLRPTP